MQVHRSVSESVTYKNYNSGQKEISWGTIISEEYTNKLKNYCSLHDLPIRSNPRNARDEKAQVDDEDKAVMNLIRRH